MQIDNDGRTETLRGENGRLGASLTAGDTRPERGQKGGCSGRGLARRAEWLEPRPALNNGLESLFCSPGRALGGLERHSHVPRLQVRCPVRARTRSSQ